MKQRDHEAHLIEIGGKDMSLLGQIARAPDDVVASGLYRGYVWGVAARSVGDLHAVAHGHRIGGADTLEAEIALDLASGLAAFVGQNDIRAAGIFDNGSFHCRKSSEKYRLSLPKQPTFCIFLR